MKTRPPRATGASARAHLPSGLLEAEAAARAPSPHQNGFRAAQTPHSPGPNLEWEPVLSTAQSPAFQHPATGFSGAGSERLSTRTPRQLIPGTASVTQLTAPSGAQPRLSPGSRPCASLLRQSRGMRAHILPVDTEQTATVPRPAATVVSARSSGRGRGRALASSRGRPARRKAP